MLDQHHGAQGVGLEREEGTVVVDLRWSFLWEEDAWDAEAEVEVGVFLWIEGRDLFGCIGDGPFVCSNVLARTACTDVA